MRVSTFGAQLIHIIDLAQNNRSCDVISPIHWLCGHKIMALLWCHPGTFQSNLGLFTFSWMSLTPVSSQVGRIDLAKENQSCDVISPVLWPALKLWLSCDVTKAPSSLFCLLFSWMPNLILLTLSITPVSPQVWWIPAQSFSDFFPSCVFDAYFE